MRRSAEASKRPETHSVFQPFIIGSSDLPSERSDCRVRSSAFAGGLQYEVVPAAEIARIVEEFPRLDMKRRMTRCFCHIAEARPETTYDNFARDFGERYVPGYSASSSVDLVSNAPFEE